MCQVCRSYPCISRCPNAKDPEPVMWCSHCGDGIENGSRFLPVDTDGSAICERCVSKMSPAELLDSLGVDLKIA